MHGNAHVLFGGEELVFSSNGDLAPYPTLFVRITPLGQSVDYVVILSPSILSISMLRFKYFLRTLTNLTTVTLVVALPLPIRMIVAIFALLTLQEVVKCMVLVAYGSKRPFCHLTCLTICMPNKTPRFQALSADRL